MESSLLLAATKLTRIRWAGLLHAIFFTGAALLAGSMLNVHLLHTVTRAVRMPSFGAMGLAVAFLFIVILILAGGIRRIGLFGKFTGYAGILLIVAALFSISFSPLTHTARFLKALASDPLSPYRPDQLPITMISVSVYFALSEFAGGRLAVISGLVRTDHPAKQGLVAQLFPAAQILLSLVVGALLFERFPVEVEGVRNIVEGAAGNLERIFSTVLLIHRDDILAPFTYLLIAVFALYLILSTVTFLYTGGMTFRHLTGNRIPNLFPAAGILLALYTGYSAESGSFPASLFFAAYLGFALFSTVFGTMLAFLFAKPARQELIRYQNSREGKRDISRDLYLMILTLLPANMISRFFGVFSLIHFPRPIQTALLKGFARFYNINLEEAEKPIEEYRNLNSFFTRALKPGVRPVDTGRKTIVSPVDGRLSRMGIIQEGLLIQAKGIYYTLKDLLGDPQFVSFFEDGHYCVLYLSPQDYHRIHTPFDCEVVGYTYSPGRLFPVNQIAVEGLTGLFPKNERLTSLLRTKYGHIAMIKVGATNVGRIRVTYDSIRTNSWFRRRKAHLYASPPRLKRGEEIGRFDMGSTVILLFEKGTMEFEKHCSEGDKVRLGQAIGYFR
jgi:phosphatidylserine decarboxylase